MLYGVGLLKHTWRKSKGNLERFQRSERDLYKKDKGHYVNFIKKAFVSMPKDAILSMLVKVVVRDQKKMAKEKAKAKAKGKTKAKALAKGEAMDTKFAQTALWWFKRRNEESLIVMMEGHQ
jgi:hypothetical protein